VQSNWWARGIASNTWNAPGATFVVVTGNDFSASWEQTGHLRTIVIVQVECRVIVINYDGDCYKRYVGCEFS
jgi:hypothetical protein